MPLHPHLIFILMATVLPIDQFKRRHQDYLRLIRSGFNARAVASVTAWLLVLLRFLKVSALNLAQPLRTRNLRVGKKTWTTPCHPRLQSPPAQSLPTPSTMTQLPTTTTRLTIWKAARRKGRKLFLMTSSSTLPRPLSSVCCSYWQLARLMVRACAMGSWVSRPVASNPTRSWSCSSLWFVHSRKLYLLQFCFSAGLLVRLEEKCLEF